VDKTFRLDPKYKIMALDDEELMPMWLMLEEGLTQSRKSFQEAIF
jgi:hypothetical protein